MKKIIHSILIVFSFALIASAQTTAKKEAALRIEVENGKTLDLTAKDLAKFARREIKAKGHDEKDSVYSGFNLSDILLSAGAKLGAGEMRGKELGAYIVIEAADGYKAVFAIAEIAPEFTDKIVLLADTRDGKPLDEKNGVWQIIVPDEKKRGRWVRQVTALKINKLNTENKSVSEINDLTDEEQIQEIIFKKIIAPWLSKTNEEFKAYYFSFDDRDPSDKLLDKFKGLKLPVKKDSESIISREDGDSILDVKTKEQGVRFTISKIEWKNKNEVKLNAGSYIGNMGGDGCDYTLKKENGAWKIASAENCYIS